MKDMKIKRKLVSGFLIVAIFAAIITVISIYGLVSMNNSEETMYQFTQNVESVNNLSVALQHQRVNYRDAMFQILEEVEQSQIETSLGQLQTSADDFDAVTSTLGAKLTTETAKQYLSNIDKAYQAYVPVRENLVQAIRDGNLELVTQYFNETEALIAPIIQEVDALNAFAMETVSNTNDADARTAAILIIVMVVLGILAVILAIVFGLYNAKLIATPVSQMAQAAEKLSVGDVDVDISYTGKDETGVLADAFRRMAAAIKEQAEVLQKIADSDYTVQIAVRSEKDSVNRAIETMLANNNQLVSNIRNASNQVASAAQQISQGAQNLASGSTQQAATIQQFSAAISEVQRQAEENTKMATTVFDDTNKAGALMGESMESMNRMTEAMQEIDESSQNIAKVIKVIDDIAFQTNILALNAAVEAARAGQHGKGFAVVADEVRNLASKSAAAAKETAALIESSVAKVAEGSTIVTETNESLQSVAELAGSNAVAMGKINEASQQQSVAINEITEGINQLSSVVQENSATAEQSAASAQEMNAQAAMLTNTVSRFKLNQSAADASMVSVHYPTDALPEAGEPPAMASGEVLF